MKNQVLRSFAALIALAFVLVLTPSVSQAGFYDGKVITLIVPNSPGGRMTRYARLFAPFIAKYTGAKEVRVVNKKGGGGVKGTNFLWFAKPDGMTIAFTSVPTLLLAQLSGSKAVKFDATKFVYLGRAATEPRVLAVGGKSSIKSIEDVVNLNRPFIFPSQGTDEDFYTMAVLSDALGFDLKIVTGYKGNSDTALAVIKGEGDGHITGWEAALGLIKSGDKRPILTIGSSRVSGYPDVPTALEVVKGKKKEAIQAIVNMLAMHRGFFGPPKMDPKATAALRKAISASFTDPDLVAEAEKSRLVLVTSDGETEQKRVTQIAAASVIIKPILAAALKSIR